jgi:hypothetical protein
LGEEKVIESNLIEKPENLGLQKTTKQSPAFLLMIVFGTIASICAHDCCPPTLVKKFQPYCAQETIDAHVLIPRVC